MDLQTLLQQAATCLDQRDFGQALRLYQEALRREPGNGAAVMGLATTLNRLGRSEEALSLLERLWTKVKRLRRRNAPLLKASVRAQMGLAYQQLGRLEEALQAFREANDLHASPELEARIQALENLSENQDPQTRLLHQARKALAQGRYDEALKAFAAVLQLNPDHVDALHGQAWAYYHQGHPDLALPILQKAIILEPEKPELFNDLGMLFQAMGNVEKAVRFHQRALKLDDGFAPAWVNLGVAYKRLGKFEEAVEAYQKALAIDPDLPEAANNLGNLLRLLGRREEAKAYLEQALKLRPDYADARHNLEELTKELQAQ